MTLQEDFADAVAADRTMTASKKIKWLLTAARERHTRLDQIIRLANAGLQVDGAHHKQYYLEEILKQAANVSELLVLWEKGVAP